MKKYTLTEAHLKETIDGARRHYAGNAAANDRHYRVDKKNGHAVDGHRIALYTVIWVSGREVLTWTTADRVEWYAPCKGRVLLKLRKFAQPILTLSRMEAWEYQVDQVATRLSRYGLLDELVSVWPEKRPPVPYVCTAE